MTDPKVTIWVCVHEGAWRIVDSLGRRYYVEVYTGRWEAEPEAFGSDLERDIWNGRTSFTEREAELLLRVLWREQRAIASADELARGLSAFENACETARKWSRRNDG